MMNAKIALVIVGALASASVLANSNSNSPRLSTAMEYEVGGGFIADPPTQIETVNLLGLGASWDLNPECGEFDPQITVSNQLNGITDGFRNMMDNIINAATGAVAQLPALAIQRANPGLYDMLQQGILQGKMDFEWASMSCEDMTAVMAGQDSFPFENFKLNAKNENMAQEIEASGGDAVAAKAEIDNANHGNDGAEWVCGNRRGGSGQPSIKALSDVVQVGYNILFDRLNSCETSTIGAGNGQGNALWEYWNGPVAASTWSTRVIGDVEIRTCDGCQKMSGTPGKGLTYMHRDMKEQLQEDLENLVDGTTSLTWQNLNLVSAPPGVTIKAPIIHAIQKRTPEAQAQMIAKLAGEIAYARLVEQGRLLTQILRTGMKEPNVASFEPAKIIVNQAIDTLQVELDQLDLEIRTREKIAQQTIQRLMGLEEKRIQETRTPSIKKTSGTTAAGQLGQ